MRPARNCWRQEARRRRKMGGGLYFYRCNEHVIKFLEKSDKLEEIGKGAFFSAMENWVKPVYATLDPEICRNCKSPHLPRVPNLFT